jgi:rhodanese-related sulfurtransferase
MFRAVMEEVMAYAPLLCPELTVEEVAELIEDRRAVLFDANPRRRWASGHLPGAINLDPGEFGEDDLPCNRNATLVFYCSDPACGASRHAAKKAMKLGFAHVFTMPAGIKGWLAAGLPVEAGRG